MRVTGVEVVGRQRAAACCLAFAVLAALGGFARGAEIDDVIGEELDYAIGADLSFLRSAEQSGVVFKDGGHAKPGLEIFKDHGYTWIRLRLFHTPDELPNDQQYTIALAKEAKELGFRFLLDIHYSDTWADPQKQFVPKAWAKLNHDELVDAVYEHTKWDIETLCAAGAAPDMVQVGNEVIGGMMWPDGRLPERWKEFADLLKAGIRGVEAGHGDSPRPLIMVHIDRGGDWKATKNFFDHCREYGVEYDVIGQSYYPWWHGTIEDLRANLAAMSKEYKKDIVLVEAAYNWRPAEYRGKPGPYPETPEGQRQFWEEVDQVVRETPDGRGKGVFWWEPAVSPGPIASRGMFDAEGNALPVITVFDDRTAQRPPAAVAVDAPARSN